MNPQRPQGRLVIDKHGAARWETRRRLALGLLAKILALGMLLYASLRFWH
jgi:hypothetical protein